MEPLALLIGLLLFMIITAVMYSIDTVRCRKRKAKRDLLFEKIKDAYRFLVAQKDLVRLPTGLLGTVTDINFFVGGNSKQARVLTVKGNYVDFYDENINLLEKRA